MVRRKRILKVIKGRVYLREDKTGSEDSKEVALRGALVNLFKVDKSVLRKDDKIEGSFTVLREKLVLSTETNKDGEYFFIVREGDYSLSLDQASLPENRMVKNTDADILSRGTVSFDFELVEDGKADGNRIDDQNISALSVNEFQIADADTQIAVDNGYDRIDDAYRNGEIDEESKVLYYLYSVFDKEKLDTGFRSDAPVKSGTTIVKELRDYIERPGVRNTVTDEISRYMISPVPELDSVYTSSGGYFKIHYTTKGMNAVPANDSNRSGIPDYVEFVGECFDHVREVTCKNRGFRYPVQDKGKDTFDVYIYDLKGVYGITFPSKFHVSSRYGKRRASCYISIDNNYTKNKGFDKDLYECAKVTAAHEFFHAIQYAYNVDADSWWKEASATWNEDEIYDEVNDYIRYIGKVFAAPEKSLEKTNYGGVVFAKYLSERFGGYQIIRRIWEVQGSQYDSSINSIDIAIREKNRFESISSVFNRYTAYNFNSAQYYEEGDLWSLPKAASTYADYPSKSKSDNINHLATKYILFQPQSEGEKRNLRISIDSFDKASWGFKIQCKRADDGLCDLIEINTSGLYDKTHIVCHNFGDVYKEVCFIPANLEKERDKVAYSYSAKVE